MTRGSTGRPVWRGGNLLPLLAGVLVIVFAVVVSRALPSAPTPMPGTGAAPSELPRGGAPSVTLSPIPSNFHTVQPAIVKSHPVDALDAVAVTSFSNGALLSVSPDARYALLWTNLGSIPQVDLVAVPLSGGSPVAVGVAGWEPRSEAPGEMRLALPAWSMDSSAVAFENGAKGAVASLISAPPIEFAATTDAPISPLGSGGFVVNASAGPQVIAGPNGAALASSAGLHDVVYFPDGTSLVATDEIGNLVWTNGTVRRVVAQRPEYALPLAWKLLSRGGPALVFAPEILPIRAAYLVEAEGSVTGLELTDPCGAPAVSDDGAYVVYHTCDRSVEAAGSAAYYSLRLVRLSDGAAINIGPGALEPVFLPGTHRLVWLGLSGNPPVQPTYTLYVATNEVLP